MIEVKTDRLGGAEAFVRFAEPFHWIMVDPSISHDDAVEILLEQARQVDQEPRFRFGDGAPAIYAGTVAPGVLRIEEAFVVVMPTKYEGEVLETDPTKE